MPLTEKQTQATFPWCPCNVTTSFSSWSFQTLTVRSQEPVAWTHRKKRWCSSKQTAQRDRDSYHTLGVRGEDAALDSCSVTPQILQHLTALRHQTTHTNMTGQSSTPVTTYYILSRLFFRFKPRLVIWKNSYSISSKCLPRSYFCVMDES